MWLIFLLFFYILFFISPIYLILFSYFQNLLSIYFGSKKKFSFNNLFLNLIIHLILQVKNFKNNTINLFVFVNDFFSFLLFIQFYSHIFQTYYWFIFVCLCRRFTCLCSLSNAGIETCLGLAMWRWWWHWSYDHPMEHVIIGPLSWKMVAHDQNWAWMWCITLSTETTFYFCLNQV